MAVQTTKTEVTIGPALGNGVAYFVLAWIGHQYGFNFDDPELAVAMGGAIVGSALLSVRRVIAWIAGLIEKEVDEHVHNGD